MAKTGLSRPVRLPLNWIRSRRDTDVLGFSGEACAHFSPGSHFREASHLRETVPFDVGDLFQLLGSLHYSSHLAFRASLGLLRSAPTPPSASGEFDQPLEPRSSRRQLRDLAFGSDHGRPARLERRPGQGAYGSPLRRFHIVPRGVKRGVKATRPPNPIAMRCSEFDLVSECAAAILLSEWTSRNSCCIA